MIFEVTSIFLYGTDNLDFSASISLLDRNNAGLSLLGITEDAVNTTHIMSVNSTNDKVVYDSKYLFSILEKAKKLGLDVSLLFGGYLSSDTIGVFLPSSKACVYNLSEKKLHCGCFSEKPSRDLQLRVKEIIELIIIKSTGLDNK